MNYLLRQKIFRPPVARDVYVAHTTERTFPGDEWVEVHPEGEAEVVEAPGCEPGTLEGSSPSSLSLIGDTKDLEVATKFVLELAPETVIVGRLPSGRGTESKIAAHLEEAGINVTYVDSAPAVNVEAVMSYDLTSPVLLVGSGTRVKQAKSWLGRANWNREVHAL